MQGQGRHQQTLPQCWQQTLTTDGSHVSYKLTKQRATTPLNQHPVPVALWQARIIHILGCQLKLADQVALDELGRSVMEGVGRLGPSHLSLLVRLAQVWHGLCGLAVVSRGQRSAPGAVSLTAPLAPLLNLRACFTSAATNSSALARQRR
jgi:hypothetical protein